MIEQEILQSTLCYHCGEESYTEAYSIDQKNFCCAGCKAVYTILSGSQLGNYYTYNIHPGSKLADKKKHFEYLNEPGIIRDLIDYQDENSSWIRFYIPSIHCSSCLWLLENLNKLHKGVLYTRVDFLKKQVRIQFDQNLLSIKDLVELLCSIGYEPLISFQDVVKTGNTDKKDRLVLKIALAGFCFGNVMLLSFPEYFGMGKEYHSYKIFFGFLNILLSLPVAFYCGQDYFLSAWRSLKNWTLHLDLPLALGILVLFLRTLYEILSQTGSGFADTLCGLVFFLLIGKWVQNKTYHHISFERDYRSFFPVAVLVLEKNLERPVALSDLKVGDRMLIRNQEIIPADAILLKGNARIDFSFVTGESIPVTKLPGEVVYAGGRQTTEAIELEIIKPVAQGYLTSLWNQEVFHNQGPEKEKTFSETLSRYFIWALFSLALVTLFIWLPINSNQAWLSFTAVLIIACPCALALSTPFTMAAALSIFDRNHLFIKNMASIEKMAGLDTLVLDKTGTLSLGNEMEVQTSLILSERQKTLIYSACINSLHPLSRMIQEYLGRRKRIPSDSFHEIPGSGYEAWVDGDLIRIGSKKLILGRYAQAESGTRVHVQINDQYLGYFSFSSKYREGLANLKSLSKDINLHLISGDQDLEKEFLKPYFPNPNALHFNISPREKMNFIGELQKKGHRVMMIGDGLNDSGALKQADLGIAITDNINNFSPGCDAILEGESFKKIPQFLQFSRDTVQIIQYSFLISLCYNLVGLGFAVVGKVSPLFAAILMPLSTLTIISFTTLATHFAAKNRHLL